MRITTLLLLVVFASEARAQKQGLTGGDLFAACAFQDSLVAGEAPKSQVSISDALVQGMCLGMISGVIFCGNSHQGHDPRCLYPRERFD